MPRTKEKCYSLHRIVHASLIFISFLAHTIQCKLHHSFHITQNWALRIMERSQSCLFSAKTKTSGTVMLVFFSSCFLIIMSIHLVGGPVPWISYWVLCCTLSLYGTWTWWVAFICCAVTSHMAKHLDSSSQLIMQGSSQKGYYRIFPVVSRPFTT